MINPPASPAIRVSKAQRLAASEFFIQASRLYNKRQYHEALETFRQCLAHHPFHVGALHGLCNCMLACHREREISKPLQLLKKLAPDHYLTRFIEAISLIREHKNAEATGLLIEVLTIEPAYYAAALALSHLYLSKYDLHKAVLLLRKFENHPQRDAALYLNLGTALLEQGRFGEAEDTFNSGLRLNRNHKAIHHNLCNLLLRKRDFARGWALYENRYPFIFPLTTPPENCPRWQGEPLQGKRILILNEQGFGDIIFASGYFAELKIRGADVLLESPPELLSLMQNHPQVNKASLMSSPLPDADYFLPAMSLPGLLEEGSGAAAQACKFPRSPYLQIDKQRIANWQQRLVCVSGFRIGIAWQGRPGFGRDRQRSFPLMSFLPLALMPGISLVSLQKGAAGKDQIPEFTLHFNLTDADNLGAPDRDFHDTAAIMCNLDLVITSDTSVAHLAGACGIPVWVMLDEVADWRWFDQNGTSYWYPSMQLLRKQSGESWRAMMTRVSEVLTSQLQS